MDLLKRTTRVQLELQSKSLARLQSLKEKTEAASYAEVIKNALRLYEYMVDSEMEGFGFLARSPDGTTKTIQVF